MKNLLTSLVCLFTLLFASCSQSEDANFITLKTESFQISVDEKGYINKFVDLKTDKNYMPEDSTAPVMLIRINNEIIPPHSAEMNENTLSLKYKNGIEANIKIEQKTSHLTFELLSLTSNEKVELITWGPYPTTIDKIIGETVGVVRGEEYAVGIQALNIKTDN